MGMPVIECYDVEVCCAASSLLQSIALEEAAIAHILNAEGEKIQRFIESCNLKKDDLLEVNCSVESMVEKLIVLENILKAKLDMILPLLEKCQYRKPCKEKNEYE
ncbi:MAG: hypothetical protein GX913_05785 [Clostridiales bacterium]|nr:hypothetical protein [Clostridiales bacterium]